MHIFLKWKGAVPALALLAMAASAPVTALAQGAGTIRGTVTDPSAAVVPGATVVATGNGVTRSVKSDGQGRYTVPNVPVGTYSVRADAQGFVTYVSPDVTVSSGQASALDIGLQLATETQQVQVQDQQASSLSVDSSSN